MLTTMMGMTEFLNWQTGLKTVNGITWFGIGAIVGWPFSGALILPLFLDELVFASMTGISDSAFRVLNGVVRVAIVAVCPSVSRALLQTFKLTIPGNRFCREYLLLPQARLHSMANNLLQYLQWLLARARHLWHRAVAFLYTQFASQFPYMVFTCLMHLAHHRATISQP